MSRQLQRATRGRLRPVRTWMAQVFGAMFGTNDHEPWTDFIGPASAAGINVTPATAMQLDAVWACVRLISETIATLPLSMFERTAKGKKLAADHPLQFVIHDQPNPESTASVFWEAMVAAMLLRGAGRAEKLVLGNRTVGLAFLDPDRLTRQVNGSGRREWRYANPDGTHRVIPPDRVWTLPGFTLDGVNGVSVIKYGAQVFGSAIAAERAASSTFKNGLLQTIYYKITSFLTADQRASFKKNLAGSIERGEAPLLEGGTEAGTLGVSPVDAQLLESRSFSVQAICRWFRVPPHMIGLTEKSTSWGTGIEQQMIGFLTFTLAPWLKRIEQGISKDLLSPAERARYYPKFAVEGLLRADSAARAAFYAVMINNGVFTRDEVRELEERPPMGGNAAVLTVQSAMTTLDSIGNADETAHIRSALRALIGLEPVPAEG